MARTDSIRVGPFNTTNRQFRSGFLDDRLTNAKAVQITYFYESRLPGEPAGGVADRHVHPVEPTAGRLTLAGRF